MVTACFSNGESIRPTTYLTLHQKELYKKYFIFLNYNTEKKYGETIQGFTNRPTRPCGYQYSESLGIVLKIWQNEAAKRLDLEASKL